MNLKTTIYLTLAALFAVGMMTTAFAKPPKHETVQYIDYDPGTSGTASESDPPPPPPPGDGDDIIVIVEYEIHGEVEDGDSI